jgi:hypothetical protein
VSQRERFSRNQLSCFEIPGLPLPDEETALGEPHCAAHPQSAEMQRRFESLKKMPIEAAVFDLDHNITFGSSKSIAPQALKMITLLRMHNVPVMISSGRRYKNPTTGSFDETDLKAAVLGLHAYIAQNPECAPARERILSGLFIAAEGGLDIANGFLETEQGKWQSFEETMLRVTGIKRNVSREKELTLFLQQLDLDEYTDLFAERLEKKYLFTFRGTREGLVVLNGVVRSKLEEAGLWDPETMTMLAGGIGLDVSFYPVDKSSSFVFFDKVLGIRDHDDGVIVSVGDSGDKGGNDYAMLAGRRGGLSADQYDPEDPCMIGLPLISGYEPGMPSVLWAMRQFKYRPTQSSTLWLAGAS